MRRALSPDSSSDYSVMSASSKASHMRHDDKEDRVDSKSDKRRNAGISQTESACFPAGGARVRIK